MVTTQYLKSVKLSHQLWYRPVCPRMALCRRGYLTENQAHSISVMPPNKAETADIFLLSKVWQWALEPKVLHSQVIWLMEQDLAIFDFNEQTLAFLYRTCLSCFVFVSWCVMIWPVTESTWAEKEILPLLSHMTQPCATSFKSKIEN